MQRFQFGALGALLTIGFSQAYGATIYGQDPNLSDFTSTVNSYGTFTSGTADGTSLPYTPTTAGLLAEGYARIIGGPGWGTINVTFNSATSHILVFDDIDHAGVAADVYQ